MANPVNPFAQFDAVDPNAKKAANPFAQFDAVAEKPNERYSHGLTGYLGEAFSGAGTSIAENAKAGLKGAGLAFLDTVPDQAAVDADKKRKAQNEAEYRRLLQAGDIAGADAFDKQRKEQELAPAQLLARDAIGWVAGERGADAMVNDTRTSLQEGIKGNQAASAAATPAGLDIVQQGVRGALDSGAMMAPGIGLEVLARGKLKGKGMAAAMGGQVYADSYGKARSAGKDIPESRDYAETDAVIEMATEYGPAALLTGIFRREGKEGIKAAIKKFAGTELVGEQLATAGQSLNAYSHGLDEELKNAKTLDKMLAIQAERQAVTAVSTALLSGGIGGAGYTYNKGMDWVDKRAAGGAAADDVEVDNPFAQFDVLDKIKNKFRKQPAPPAPLGLPRYAEPHPDDVYLVDSSGNPAGLSDPDLSGTKIKGILPRDTATASQEQPKSAGLDMGSVVDKMIGAESAGNASAKNPYSSAEGLGQFIDSTWLKMIKQHRPDVANGKSDSEILGLKTNGALSREMTTRYAEDNMRELQSSGFEASGRNVYLAHHFGVGGARTLLQASGAKRVEDVMPKQVIAQNPYMKGKTVAQVLGIIARKMGESAGAVSDQAVERMTADAEVASRKYEEKLQQRQPSTPQSLSEKWGAEEAAQAGGQQSLAEKWAAEDAGNAPVAGKSRGVENSAAQDAPQAVNAGGSMQSQGVGVGDSIAQPRRDFGFDAMEEPLTPSPSPSRGEGNKSFTPTHEFMDGTPVVAHPEDKGVLVDAAGSEYEGEASPMGAAAQAAAVTQAPDVAGGVPAPAAQRLGQGDQDTGQQAAGFGGTQTLEQQPAALDAATGIVGGYVPTQPPQDAQAVQGADVGNVPAGSVPQDGQAAGVGIGGGLTAPVGAESPVDKRKSAWQVTGASRDLVSETAKANVRQFAQDRKVGAEKKISHKALQVGDEFWVEEASPRAVGGKSTRSGIITGISGGNVSYDTFYMGKYSPSAKPVKASRLTGGYIMRGDDVSAVTIGDKGNQEPRAPNPAAANPVVDVVDSVFESGKKVVVLAGDAASAAALAGDGVLVATNKGGLLRKMDGVRRIVFDGVAPEKVLGNKRMKKLMDGGVQFVFVSALPVDQVSAAFEGIC